MKLITNFLYLSGAEVFSKAATFVAVAYLARVAGPDGYGYLEFAGAVLLCAGLIVDQGFDPYGAREIAKTPDKTASLVSEIVIVRIFLGLVAYLLVMFFAFLLNKPPFVTQLLLIYGLSLFASPFLLRWVFQGHSMMGTAASIQVVRQILYAGVVIIFIRAASQIWIAGLAEFSGVLGGVIFGGMMYRRHLGENIRLRFRLTKRLFLEGVPIGLSQIFWMIRIFGATVIVGIVAFPQDVGYFSSGMRIFIALHAFIWLYFFNLLPSLSQAWIRNDGTFSGLIAKSLGLVAWVSVLAGFLWVVLASKVITIIYGPAFSPAVSTLQCLAGLGIVSALSGHYRYGLIASGYQTIEMAISAVGAVIAILLIPLGYKNDGITGAALGLTSAEVVVWFITWWFAKAKLRLEGHIRLILGPLAAITITVFIVWVVPTWLIVFRILLGLIAICLQALVYDGAIRNNFYRIFANRLPWTRDQSKEGVNNLLNR
jgi:PST family polysaccharide transporter